MELTEEEREKFIELEVRKLLKNGVYDIDEYYFDDNIDEFFMEAATLVVRTQQGSTSLIQRKIKLGYNRVGRIMDQLEEFNIVGAPAGSKAREVKIKTIEELQMIFDGRSRSTKYKGNEEEILRRYKYI